ncbi:hypothetical protein HK104_003359 [Borealophlyctis nickersoniae]|nr:hypothetical protein HK104_003359 [Borealophlyctis nickersoniae]
MDYPPLLFDQSPPLPPLAKWTLDTTKFEEQLGPAPDIKKKQDVPKMGLVAEDGKAPSVSFELYCQGASILKEDISSVEIELHAQDLKKPSNEGDQRLLSDALQPHQYELKFEENQCMRLVIANWKSAPFEKKSWKTFQFYWKIIISMQDGEKSVCSTQPVFIVSHKTVGRKKKVQNPGQTSPQSQCQKPQTRASTKALAGHGLSVLKDPLSRKRPAPTAADGSLEPHVKRPRSAEELHPAPSFVAEVVRDSHAATTVASLPLDLETYNSERLSRFQTFFRKKIGCYAGGERMQDVLQIAAALLKDGARAEDEGYDCSNVLHTVCKNRPTPVNEQLIREFVDFLRKNDSSFTAAVRAANKDGYTPPQFAVFYAKLDLAVDWLQSLNKCERRAAMLHVQNNGSNILHVAASKGRLSFLRNVFSNPDDFGLSTSDVAHLLLQKSDIGNGQTPLGMAQFRLRPEKGTADPTLFREIVALIERELERLGSGQ